MQFTQAACSRDAELNHQHRNALRTVTRYIGTRHWDYAECFYGRLVSGCVGQRGKLTRFRGGGISVEN